MNPRLSWPDMQPRADVEALARYNAEVARGIVHTKAYDRQMADLQRRFDELQRRELAYEGERIERAEAER